MADEAELGGDDVGWWNCSLCTYKNSADKFKCEICDLKRGTSTRKPRSSADTVVAQVVKQQEQIRQQTRAKPSPKSKSGSGASQTLSSQSTNASNDPKVAGSAATTTTAGGLKKVSHSRTSTPSVSSDARNPTCSLNSEFHDAPVESESGSISKINQTHSTKKVSSSSTKRAHQNASKQAHRKSSSLSSKKSKGNKSYNNSNHNNADDDDDADSDDTSVASDALSQTLSLQLERSASDASLDDSSQFSSSSATTPEPTTSSPNHSTSLDSKQLLGNPFKIRPVEINGNLIKYSPPTSSGRTGLIIDKKRFTQHSVTVNDVTITFTEFATRQNKYIRKKKKRSGRAALPPANTNTATPTAGAE